jgi:UrcA family protein
LEVASAKRQLIVDRSAEHHRPILSASRPLLHFFGSGASGAAMQEKETAMLKFSIIAAVLASLLVQPARAAEAADVRRSARVAYADLDLSSDAGVTRLDRRINRAIEQLCFEPGSIVDLRSSLVARRCREAAKASLAEQRQQVIAAARRPALAAR